PPAAPTAAGVSAAHDAAASSSTLGTLSRFLARDGEVAAAKAAASDAAHAAARAALQLHGAIGYTAEYDLSLWLGKARALRSAWGSPAACRARTLDIFRE
ncbi:hypothetical protein B7P34_36020, partial [Streptosporangium nondiastaticum]